MIPNIFIYKFSIKTPFCLTQAALHFWSACAWFIQALCQPFKFRPYNSNGKPTQNCFILCNQPYKILLFHLPRNSITSPNDFMCRWNIETLPQKAPSHTIQPRLNNVLCDALRQHKTTFNSNHTIKSPNSLHSTKYCCRTSDHWHWLATIVTKPCLCDINQQTYEALVQSSKT